MNNNEKFGIADSIAALLCENNPDIVWASTVGQPTEVENKTAYAAAFSVAVNGLTISAMAEEDDDWMHIASLVVHRLVGKGLVAFAFTEFTL